MSSYVVTILDTTGIQPYIFNSNRLRENIGASYLVSQVTDGWVKDILDEDFGVSQDKHNNPTPITNGAKAELVYAGGGNTLLLFQSIELARDFVKKLSRRILENAPGLNLVAAHQPFSWNESLYDVVQNLMDDELEKQKRARIASSPLLGLGVTASCQSTQLPATKTSQGYFQADEEDIYLVSRETEAKLKVVSPQYKEPANQAIREKFANALAETNYQFPSRMDRLGRSKEESSYYAVVHADGNNMGQRFKDFGKQGMQENSADPNRGYIEAMRKLSNSVNEAGLKAMKIVLKAVINSIKDGEVMGKFPIKDDCLPFRPLVYGGDDVTFVCDGRLGLELAAIYLQELQKPELAVADGKPITACAGICIVKSHYPFARAYALSEALCRNAKTFAKEQKKFYRKDFSALDWHIAASGLLGSISEIRIREYQGDEGELTMRPILIQDVEWRNWSNFTNTVECFNGNHQSEECQQWKGRRNKIIALREKLRERREAIKQFCQAYGISRLPPVNGGNELDLQTDGWKDGRCGYFDAIEAMEFYFPLNKGESGDSLQNEN